MAKTRIGSKEQTAFLFSKVRKYIAKHHPFLRTVQFKYCKSADDNHKSVKRIYAHVLHFPKTICIAKAFKELPVLIQLGLFFHEFGHIIAERLTEDGSQQAADIAVASLGVPLSYTHDKLELEIVPDDFAHKVLTA